MCLAILSVVVNPAEGLGAFEVTDLRAIYRRCGPAIARIVIEAIAAATLPADDRCHCASASGPSLLREFARFARYQGDPADA